MSRQEVVTSPVARREQGNSARALLLTVLGEFVLPAGGSAATSTLLDALGAVDIEVRTGRQALARSSAAGLLTSERVGRHARWTLTGRAHRLLTEGTERIYSFGWGQPAWDGRWLLLLASVPESNRHLRYRLRVRLEWEGFASVAPGVWISPWVDREPAARSALDDIGLGQEAQSFVGTAGAIGLLDERVYQAWDLAALEAAYAGFIAGVAGSAPAPASSPAPPSDAECFVSLVRLVHEWRQFPAADPGLPASLLPARWDGHRAAEVFHDRHAAWVDGAWRWWVLHGGDGRRPGG